MKKDTQVNFRMPADLKAHLQAAAAENEHSLTSEIVERLEHSLLGETADRVGTRFLASLFGGLQKVDELADKLGVESRVQALDAAEDVIEISLQLAFPMHLVSLAMSELPTLSSDTKEGGEFASNLTREEAADIMRDLAMFQLRLSGFLSEALQNAQNTALTREERQNARHEIEARLKKATEALISFANETGLVRGYSIVPASDQETE